VGGQVDLLSRLAVAIASTPSSEPLSVRLCHACRDLAEADGAAITVAYTSPDRVTLCATDAVASRLEDLQDIIGEGPGRTAAVTGQIEVCPIPNPDPGPWAQFSKAAEGIVRNATIHAVPMVPGDAIFGVLTLYRSRPPPAQLGLDAPALLKLAAAAGAALVRDPASVDDELVGGPWSSRSQIHQATGMVVAQLGVGVEDALAVLRAHAYAGDTTLAVIAASVVDRTLRFTNR